MADGDASKYGTVTIYDDVIFEDGMAVNAFDGLALLVKWEALGSESDTLIELYMVADDTGGTDDYSSAMIDGEVVTDGGGGVYVYACFAMGHLGDDAWDEGYTQ